MAKETDKRLEQWMQDVGGVRTDRPATSADYAWSDYESAQRNLEETRANQPPQPSPPIGGIPPGTFGTPESLPVQAAGLRLADAKIGLAAADTEAPWEQSAIQREAASAQDYLKKKQESELQDQYQQDLMRQEQEAQAPLIELRSRAQDARGRANAVLGEDIVRARQAGEEIIARRELMDQNLLKDEQAARLRAEQLQNAFDQAALDMDSVRVDPQRWEKATPALAQVFMALASSAFAFFSGGRGVNPVVELIDRAIDRDLKAQMNNADRKMKKINAGLEGEIVRERLESTIRTAMQERAAQGLKFMMDNTRDESLRAMQKAAYFENLAKVQDLHADRYEKYLMGMAKLQAAQAQAQAKAAEKESNVQWNDKTVAAQVQASTQGVRELNKVWDLYSKTLETKGGKAGRIAGSILGGEYSPFTTTEGVYNEQKGSLGITMAKAAAGFQVSEADRKAFETKLPGVKDSPEIAVRKMAGLVDQTMTKLFETYRMASPADKKRMGPEVQSSIMEVLKFVQSVPQVARNLSPTTKELLKRSLGQ